MSYKEYLTEVFADDVSNISIVEMMKQLNPSQRKKLDQITMKVNLLSSNRTDLIRLSPEEKRFLIELNNLYDGEVGWLQKVISNLN